MKPHETTIVSDYIWYSGRKVICNNFSRIIPFILFNLSPWALLSAGFLVESSKQSRWMSSKIWRWVGWAHTNREIQEDMYTILYMNTQYIYIYDYDDYDYIYSCPHRLFAHNYIATICIVAFGSSKTSSNPPVHWMQTTVQGQCTSKTLMDLTPLMRHAGWGRGGTRSLEEQKPLRGSSIYWHRMCKLCLKSKAQGLRFIWFYFEESWFDQTLESSLGFSKLWIIMKHV